MNKSVNQSINQAKKSARRALKQPKNQKKNSRGSKPQYGSVRRTQAPITQGNVSVMSRPVTRNLPNGDIIIRHREFIFDITSSADFSVARFAAINPGSPNMFPWLSGIANNYESYIFNSLIFRYENSCNTVTAGTVILAIDYDPDDVAPTSKQQVLAYRGSVRSSAWSHSEHRSLREDLSKRKSYFVRRGALPANAERDTYDVGTLAVCTQGTDGALPIGELYVEYEVKLMTPQLGDISIGQSLYARLTGSTLANAFLNSNGPYTNLAINVTNVSPRVWAMQFAFPWQGYVTLYVSGSGLSFPNAFTAIAVGNPTISSVQISNDVVSGTLNEGMASLYLNIGVNDFLTFEILSTTIVATMALFGQAKSA